MEDALFSQTSLNTYLNGRTMAKLSNWTSAIAKIYVANKYGRKNYSTKAYPSPELTRDEQEIIFRCAEKAGYDPRIGDMGLSSQRQGIDNSLKNACKYIFSSETQDSNSDKIVAENRWILMNNYYLRKQPTYKFYDVAPFIDYNRNKIKSLTVSLIEETKNEELRQAKLLSNLQDNQVIFLSRKLCVKFEQNGISGLQEILDDDNLTIEFEITKDFQGLKISTCSITLPGILFNSVDEYVQQYIGNEFFINHSLHFLFPYYLEDVIEDLCWCDIKDETFKAMPQEVVDKIVEEINEFQKLGCFENDLSETDYIERMEKCVVLDKKGLTIDLVEQKNNIKKKYSNTQETFTIFYDMKTMLPFVEKLNFDFSIYDQKCIGPLNKNYNDSILNEIKEYFNNIYPNENWFNLLTEDDYIITNIVPRAGGNLIFFKITKHETIKLKQGTRYYKWSKTINEDTNNETFLGTEISINSNTFCGEFLITGETLIREQTTGKDQHVQFVINRAALSSSTNIQLQASGNPTTFSIDINVLEPKNGKPMMSLKQFDVEEDTIQGGYQIVPQNKKHIYTRPMEIVDESIIENNKIY